MQESPFRSLDHPMVYQFATNHFNKSIREVALSPSKNDLMFCRKLYSNFGGIIKQGLRYHHFWKAPFHLIQYFLKILHETCEDLASVRHLRKTNPSSTYCTDQLLIIPTSTQRTAPNFIVQDPSWIIALRNLTLCLVW